MTDNTSENSGKTSVFLVDDHPLVRQGLTQIINNESDLEVTGEAADAAQALTDISKQTPDLVIADISLRGTNGLELIKNIKAVCQEYSGSRFFDAR
jgi:YesN/AraC family two-component response regulator